MLSRRLLRIKVAQGLYSHIQSGEKNIARTRKEFILSARQCYLLYLLIFQLLADIRGFALEKIEIGRNKMRPTPAELNPNMRFVENPILTLIDNSSALRSVIGKNSWGDHTQLLRELYTALTTSEFYQEYMDKEKVTFNDHKKLIRNILEQLLEDNQQLEEQLEEQSIFWLDDIGYTLSIALQTINVLSAKDTDLDLQEQYKDDHEEFAIELLEKSIIKYNDNITLIDKHIKNWEVERIALMDKILLTTAITELTCFPSIPIKTTLDEYIEIAKYYSTPQSGTFINGVLDNISTLLTQDGTITKTGRGLI